MMKSSLGGRDRADVTGGLPGKSLAHLRAFVRVYIGFPSALLMWYLRAAESGGLADE
jgi:hypothetical protein